MHKRVYLILLLVAGLGLGIWSASPARNAAAQPARVETSACDQAADQLVGNLATFPRARDLIHDICDFRVRLDDIPSDVSEFDRLFIENTIASNILEIQSLQFALERATNEEWRGLINMMIIMHTSDLEMAVAIAEKIGADTEPDLTNVRVYPDTPAYDLGMRRINLVERFLNPLMGISFITPTPVPTETTTGIPTDMLTGTATGIPTDMLTGTATGIPTDMGTGTATGIATDTATETGTALPTDTVTETATGTATETATSLPTDTATETATGTATETATGLPTDTTTALPTDMGTITATGVATDTPATMVTDTATGVPTLVLTGTPGPGPGTNFDALSMEVIEDEHVLSIETALVAQRLVENDEVRAFAKHAADAAHLHLMLIDDLKYRLIYNITLPPPRFQADYRSPRSFQSR